MAERKRGRKQQGELRDPVIQRIFDVTGWRSQAQMCAALGKDESVLSARLSRGETVHEDWLWQIVARFDVELRWLLTAEGPQRRQDPTIRSLGPAFMALAASWEGLGEVERETLARCAVVLSAGSPELREALRGLFQFLEGTVRPRSRRHPARLLQAARETHALPPPQDLPRDLR